MTRYQIGDQDFSDMANLLNFYRTHYLDTTTLVRPVRNINKLLQELYQNCSCIFNIFDVRNFLAF